MRFPYSIQCSLLFVFLIHFEGILTGADKTNKTKPAFLPKSCGTGTKITPKLPKLPEKGATGRIVDGQIAYNGSWPWMAVIFADIGNGSVVPHCGGALVTHRHVVTAAHCIVVNSKVLDAKRFSVRLGGHNVTIKREPGSMTFGVAEVRKADFDSSHYKNDVAVLKLSSPVNFTDRISPVCLPYDSLNGEDLTNKTAYVLGVGRLAQEGSKSDVLRQAEIQILEQEVCKPIYEPLGAKPFTKEYLCAGSRTGSQDACQGDSGGPLLTTGLNDSYYLVGVVSFGKNCGKNPGVYARITEYLDWLTKNLSD